MLRKNHELEKYLDSGRLNFVDVFMRTARNFGDLQFNYKRDLGNELKRYQQNISWAFEVYFTKMRKDKPSKDDADFEEQTLAKVFLYWRLMILLH